MRTIRNFGWVAVGLLAIAIGRTEAQFPKLPTPVTPPSPTVKTPEKPVTTPVPPVPVGGKKPIGTVVPPTPPVKPPIPVVPFVQPLPGLPPVVVGPTGQPIVNQPQRPGKSGELEGVVQRSILQQYRGAVHVQSVKVETVFKRVTVRAISATPFDVKKHLASLPELRGYQVRVQLDGTK